MVNLGDWKKISVVYRFYQKENGHYSFCIDKLDQQSEKNCSVQAKSETIDLIKNDRIILGKKLGGTEKRYRNWQA